MIFFGKFCVFVWVCIIWDAHRKGGFPLKLKGSDHIFIVYTEWRMFLLLGAPFILMGIPVFIYGMDYPMMDQPIIQIYYWGSVLATLTSVLVATIVQIMANRREKPKRKAK